MSNWFILTLGFFLFATADVPGLRRLHPITQAHPTFPAGEEIAVLPNVVSAGDDQRPSGQPQANATAQPLNESAKLELIRYVSGEFAKATKALPGGKDGFYVNAGQPIDAQLLNRAVATHGAAVNAGDSVQITRLEFRDHTIVVDLNGGGRPKKHWKDHIQLSVGGGGGIPTSRTTSTTAQQDGPPGMQPGMGSTVFLEFGKHVPNLTPDELKQHLSAFLDFSKQRSASVQWIDTLPPEMKKAIQERRPVVGMDREEVIAAIGKPEHKVRERDAEGQEIEDWIYGQPPSKTIFVRFMGDRVTSIRQYPQ